MARSTELHTYGMQASRTVSYIDIREELRPHGVYAGNQVHLAVMDSTTAIVTTPSFTILPGSTLLPVLS